MIIYIENVPISPDEMWKYAIRWYGLQHPMPTLYKQGKRVTQAWKVTEIEQLADLVGCGNANCAD